MPSCGSKTGERRRKDYRERFHSLFFRVRGCFVCASCKGKEGEQQDEDRFIVRSWWIASSDLSAKEKVSCEHPLSNVDDSRIANHVNVFDKKTVTSTTS